MGCFTYEDEMMTDELLNDAQLSEALASRPAPRVTEDVIKQRIRSTDYFVIPGTTVTICQITLDNGYSVRGESACVSPLNFDEAIGRAYAHKDAFQKLWPLFGFLLAEKHFRSLGTAGE